jgi:S-adenosylmethionine:tRNA ribosyltransferase-isomerase
MELSDFDYILPKELIAQYPLAKRDTARLMVVDRARKTIKHCVFQEVLGYLEPHDVLVLNDTKVIPARLSAVKKDTLGKVDVLLSQRLSAKKFQALIRPRLSIGQEVIFNHGSLKAKVVDEKTIEFNQALSPRALEKVGMMPLPPYIKRQPEGKDRLRYQTVYSKKPGAIAAPTAGLHFSKKVLRQMQGERVKINYVTLHVGLGTFTPVKLENIQEHVMEKEAFSVSQKTLQAIAQAKKNRKRIFAVGTTTTRVLETVSDLIVSRQSSIVSRPPHYFGGRPSSKSYTNLFIFPGYKFKVIDCLLTNFHLPKTTLFMLVCAFAGRDLIMQAYVEAIKGKYRFYSYGDAMLII